MNFSCLTPAEVREKYRRAEHKDVMLEILADLTCSSKKEMRAFLGLPPLKVKKSVPYSERPKLNEAKALKMYNEGLSDPEIARAQGVSANAVALWRRRNGLISLYHAKMPNLDDRMRMYRQGMTDKEIAEAQGVAYKRVAEWRRNRGLPPNKRRT